MSIHSVMVSYTNYPTVFFTFPAIPDAERNCMFCYSNPRSVVCIPCQCMLVCTKCFETHFDQLQKECPNPYCDWMITEHLQTRGLPIKISYAYDTPFCVGCWKVPPTTVSLPCRHLLLCADCAKGCIKCPLQSCRVSAAEPFKKWMSVNKRVAPC